MWLFILKKVPNIVKHINMLKYLGIKKVMVTCYPQVDDENIIYIYIHTHPYIYMYIHKMYGWMDRGTDSKEAKTALE